MCLCLYVILLYVMLSVKHKCKSHVNRTPHTHHTRHDDRYIIQTEIFDYVVLL